MLYRQQNIYFVLFAKFFKKMVNGYINVVFWLLASFFLNQIFITEALAQTVFTRSIESSSDDAEESGSDGSSGSGVMNLTSTKIQLVRDDSAPSSGAQIIGLRFTNINIPKGAVINNAYITFKALTPNAPNTNSGVTSVTIKGELANSPNTFNSNAFNLSSRLTTASQVSWNSIGPWTSNVTYNTPNLSSIVQELVNRSGWNSGNSMAFIINGSGSRTAESWDDDGTNQPVLTITYTTIQLSVAVTDVSTPQGSNGAIDLTVVNGVAPFTYLWSNGATTQDINNLTAGIYTVTVSDSNGAIEITSATVLSGSVFKQLYLTGPGQLMDRISPEVVSESLKSSSTLYSPQIGVLNSEYRVFNNSNTFYGLYNSPDGPNRMLIIGISVRNRNDIFTTNVRYNNIPLTLVATRDYNEDALVYIYRLLNPPVGEYYVEVNFNSNVTRAAVIGLATLHGVHQTTPTGPPATISADATGISLNVPSVPGDLVFGVVSKRNASSAFNTAQTQRWNAYSNETRGAANSAVATSASTTLSWTGSNNTKGVMAGVAIKPVGGNPTTTFTQSPTMCSNFVIKSGTITIKNYINIISGTMSANPNITAVLKYGGNNIISISNPTYNSTTGLMTWIGTLNNDFTIPQGGAISLEVTSSEPLVEFQIQYDHSTKPSHIELPTSTFIDVPTLAIYDQPYPNGNIITNTTNGSQVYIRATTTDPFGHADITGLSVGVLNPPAGPFEAVSVNATGCTKIFQYLWTTPSTPGEYDISVTAREGYENTVTYSKQIQFALCPLTVTNTVTHVTSCTNSNGSILLNVNGGDGPYNYSWTRTLPSGSGNGTGTNISGLAAGNYNITVTSAKGCSGTTTAVINVPIPPQTSANITNVSCFGGSNGQLIQTVTDGIGPFTYAWANSGITTKDRTGLSSGAYTVTITDSGGCTVVGNYSITQPTAMTASNDKIDPTCTVSGNITLTIGGGGTGVPYNYSWIRTSPSGNGSGSGTAINNLSHGQYTITVTSALGCTATTTATLIQALPPVATGFITDVSCFGSNNGVINQLVSGGTLPYSYQWANSNETTINRSGLTAGTYTVTITDGKNCTLVKNYVINQPFAIIISPTVINPQCALKGSITMQVTGGNSPYLYNWADMDGNNNTASRIGLSSGDFALTVSDIKGCTSTYSTQLNEAECPPSLAVCTSDLEESFSTPVDPFTETYTWRVPIGATIVSGQGTPNIKVNWSGATPGDEQICVSKSNTCGESDEYCQNVFIKGVLASISVDPVCTGAELVLYASGGSQYQWSGPDGFSSTSDNPIRSNVNASHAGYYSVTVTDTDGCKGVAGRNINLEDGPMTTAQVYNASCGAQNGFIDLSVFSGAPPYNYAWSTGANTQDIYTLSRGNYVVTVTDSNGCQSTASASVGELNGPSVSLIPTEVACFGSSTGVIETEVMGGNAPYQYFWSNGATTPNLNNVSAGLYRLTVVDNNGCGDVESITLFQPSALFANQMTTDVDCVGSETGSVTIEVSGGEFPYTILWSDNSTSFSRSALSSGYYTAVVTDASNCSQNVQVQINEPMQPLSTSAIVYNVNCFENNDGRINLTVQGGTKPYTYQWYSDDYPSFSATTEDLSGLNIGTYRVTVTDTKGCTSSSQMVITQPQILTTALSATHLTCFKSQDGSISQNISGGTGPYNVLWADGLVTLNRSNIAAGAYFVTVSDSKGCLATNEITVVEPSEIIYSLTSTNIGCNSESSGEITLNVSGGTPSYSYTWSNGSVTKDINNLDAGLYSVTISDSHDCSNMAQVQIEQETPFGSDEFIKHVSCNGGNDGAIDFFVRGGVPPYTFEWSTGATTKDVSDLSEGAYMVTFTDAVGCSASSFFVVSEPTALYTANLIFDTNCFGGSDGTITAYPTGGIAPYQLAWSTGSSEQTITVSKGTYSITVTDRFGCVETKTAFVDSPQKLELSGNITHACSGQSNGYISLNISGGTLPYTYTWSDAGPPLAIRSGLSGGIYQVTASDANGCSEVASFNIDPLSITFSTIAPTCGTDEEGDVISNSDGEVYAIIEGGTRPYNVAWSTGSDQEFITGLAFGNYTITVTNQGCGVIASAALSEGLCVPPIANDDLYVTEMNVPIIDGSVANNDYDPNNEYPLTFFPLDIINADVGLIEWDTSFNGTFSFTPALDYFGTIEIPYLVCDTLELCDEAILQIIVSKPVLGLAKSVSSSPVLNIEEGYDFTYTIYVENMSQLTLSDIQVSDNLNRAMSGSVSWSLNSIESEDFVINPNYDGVTDTLLLTGVNSINAFDIGEIHLNMTINSGINLGPYFNTAQVNGTSPQGVQLFDISQTGTNPDPDNDGDPTNNNEPTELLLCPNISITGDEVICVGNITTLTPVPDGTWISSNPSVAQVNNSGVVVGISAGFATFTFIETLSGCVTNATDSIQVIGKPLVMITGDTSICAGTTTTLSPSTGGIWTSSNTAVATISNSGVVTGQNPGTAIFYYVSLITGCSSEASAPIHVRSNPQLSLQGESVLCPGDTTLVLPSTNGVWTSANPFVATVTNEGMVTGVSNGVTQLTFVTNTGCSRNSSISIAVNGNTFVQYGGPSTICQGSTTQLLPSTGGIWTSLNDSLATITSLGTIMAHEAGEVSFYFTDNQTGCISNIAQSLIILPLEHVSITGSDSICVGTETSLSPSEGGIWFSNNPSVGSVALNGIVTGISEGTVNFTFVSSTTGCSSNPTEYVTIIPRPTALISDQGPICPGEIVFLTPNVGGTWSSSNPLIATVTDDGVVTAIGQGSVRFTFTDTLTGCISLQSLPLQVHPKPIVAVIGDQNICVGSTTILFPNVGGIWESIDTAVAQVSISGVVTALTSGSVQFQFTEFNTGCLSDLTAPIQIFEIPVTSLLGSDIICSGYISHLSPSQGGIWESSNDNVASVTSAGLITGHAPGSASFIFTSSSTGCSSIESNIQVTVNRCIQNDFNIAIVNIPITGDVSINDNIPDGAAYGQSPILLQKPDVSLPVMNVNSDGTYVFLPDVAGIYVYQINVCFAPDYTICQTSLLEIHVSELQSRGRMPVAMPDKAITYTNSNPLLPGVPVTLLTLANDKCVYTGGCHLDTSTVEIITSSPSGFATVGLNGDITFTPNPGFSGTAFIQYKVCVENEPGNCASAWQTIDVLDEIIEIRNSTDATDDFYVTFRETAISGNLLINDFDKEGDVQQVILQGSVNAPVIVTGGQYWINSNGDFTFTPEDGFAGSVSFSYTVCDINASQKCVNANVFILVMDDLQFRIRVYLEGSLYNNGNAISSTGRPLMRDNLRSNPFNGLNYIPVSDPYKNATEFIDIRSKYQHRTTGLLSKFNEIINPSAVFSVSGQNAIVDWVFVELRSSSDSTNVLATRSGLLQRDGDITEIDGISPLRFPMLQPDSFFVVVRHRNHLGVMSMKIHSENLVDFTSPDTPIYDFGTSKGNGYNYTGLAQKSTVLDGYMAMWGGDFDGDRKIKYVNPNDDHNILFYDVLAYPLNFNIASNYNFGFGYIQGDFDMDGKVKYDNPNDDKNLLFLQIIFYPQNINFISNFSFFIEQIPNSN